MGFKFSLSQLALAMQENLVEYGSSAVVAFGWRARQQVINQGPGGASRIVLIPGDPDSGNAGTLERGHLVSTNPRVLLTWGKLVTMSVWGVDSSSDAALQDEAKQAIATENLFELAVRAAHNAVDPDTGDFLGAASLHWLTPKWSTKNTNLYFGRELLVPFVQKGPLFDSTFAVTTTAQAVINRDLTT
jgi:hypothetical protein